MTVGYSIIDVPQRSPEWHAARLGLVTGSAAGDMLAETKGGQWARSRTNLRVRLALERITGRPIGSDYQSNAMRKGIAREPEAVALYELNTGQIVGRCGFLRHDSLQAGFSPDGLVGDTGLIEVKCPLPAQHLDALRGKAIVSDYRAQVQHGLWITGAQWCDWVSYCPEFPDGLQLVIRRVESNDFDRMVYERALRAFLDEVRDEESEIRSLEAA